MEVDRCRGHTGLLNALDCGGGALEAVFRRHAGLLQTACAKPGAVSLAIDGKTLRGSFNHFRDRAAAQVLGVFATDTALVLAHSDIGDKSNDPGRPGAARPRRPLGHARCPALPKKTFEAGADAQIDLIIQLKDNQPTLHQQAKDLCASATPLSQISSRDRG